MAESPREELVRRLSEYPREPLTYFKNGFSIASRLSEDARKLVLPELLKNFKRGRRHVGGAALRVVTGLPAREAEQLAAVYSIIIGLLSESAATPADFVAAAKGILFDAEHEVVATSIADAICAQREEISTAITRAQLAGEVLPSLDTFEVVTDLRIRFAEGQIKTLVPVAIVHVDTDGPEQELWLQLSVGDIEEIVKKLSEALTELKEADLLVIKSK